MLKHWTTTNNEDESIEQSLFVYKQNTIIIHGGIVGETAIKFCEFMPMAEVYAKENNKNVVIEINSTGGYFECCIPIINKILISECEVITDITGVAFSAAAFIALAGDKRKISNIGSIMIHNPIFSSGEESLQEKEIFTAYTREHFDRFAKTIIEDTKITLKKFKEECDRDWYLTPKQAKKNGIIHEIY